MLETTFLAGDPSETLRQSNENDLNPDELYWKGLALVKLG